MLFSILLLFLSLTVALALWDVAQKRHSILRNFPILGHFRYWFEKIGPELRQYIVTSNNDERPFSRDQRRWVYASAKGQNNQFGFGTDIDLEQSPNTLIIKHAAFPLEMPKPGDDDYDPRFPLPCGKVLGAARQRRHCFRPPSLVNVSGMSLGSLSAQAVEALNRGCRLAGCLHNTGEGGVSPYHQHGGELTWQLGTAYFGCRDQKGRFSLDKFIEVVANNPVRAIEIKLSQGAKPNMGGFLPAVKVTPEIAAIRGIPEGRDFASPASHTEFHDTDSMLDFVELLADVSGLPVGIKSAVGDQRLWQELSQQMATTGRGVDFITIDGGEGGTGAAPLAFTDHVALPFKLAMSRVYREFVELGIQEEIVFIGSGRLGLPETALFAFGLGCDMVNVGRQSMLSIGCIQAQQCHTGHCPSGVATHHRWLSRGLVPDVKAPRLAKYVVTLRKELQWLSSACGVAHPALVGLEHFEIMDGKLGARRADEIFGYGADWGLPSLQRTSQVNALMQPASST